MSDIVLISPKHSQGLEKHALDILQEEIEKRTGLLLSIHSEFPDGGAAIVLAKEETLQLDMPHVINTLKPLAKPGPEGWRMKVESTAPLRVMICGADDRGCLFGAGWLLRKLCLTTGKLAASNALSDCSITPRYGLRGHQLAYRDKQNTCPNWTAEDFDEYIRTLALFGSNAIEILPPRTDDRLFSPLFRLHPMEMMTRLSQIIHSYGLDVWMWYPCLGDDYTDPATFVSEIEERERVFSAIPWLDAILIPAGDPGDLAPREFFKAAQAMMQVAHRYHPNAKVYIAPQAFAPERDWYAAFYSELSREPEWLYGVCYAPWIADTLAEMAERVPPKYRHRIRNYPDITHTAACQFEVQQWDGPMALLHGRESCSPRPLAMKVCHNFHAPLCIGSLTYSEGIHDDVNKFVWTDQDMDPDRDPHETVLDYARLLIDPLHAEEIAELIFALEQSYIGKLEENTSIDNVYQRFIALHDKLPQKVRDNYRYKMLYQRALEDVYTKKRYIADQQLEQAALALLEQAPQIGSAAAIHNALAMFRRTYDEPTAEDIRFDLWKLGHELYQSPGCRMQQSTVLHNAQHWVRGAWLDTLNTPLNDMQWYTWHCTQILHMTNEKERLAAIHTLLYRTDPGADGLYINLGSIDGFRCVVQDLPWEQDPGRLRSAHLFHDIYGLMIHFHNNAGWHNEFPITTRWAHQARTLYGTPLKVHIDGLADDTAYILQVTYPDIIKAANPTYRIALYAGGKLIHDEIRRDTATPCDPVYRFALPAGAVSNGTLDLRWQAYDTLYPVAVSEIWLMRA